MTASKQAMAASARSRFKKLQRDNETLSHAELMEQFARHQIDVAQRLNAQGYNNGGDIFTTVRTAITRQGLPYFLAREQLIDELIATEDD